MKTCKTGKTVIEALLALGDGDSMVVEGQQWTSFEQHGFEVQNLGEGGIERVERADAASRFLSSKLYEVVE